MTPEEVLRATGGRALLADALPADIRISTDTRGLRPGDTFLALRGERFDGHRFTTDARRGGAAAVIVDDAATVPGGTPAIVVDDTRTAYLAIAAAARAAMRAAVVVITGSTGKTTTKELLVQIVRFCGRTVAGTPRNENNEIGVSKLFTSLPDDADVVVAELGARHYGDIAPLVAVARPDVAILTNVGDAHLEIMGSFERLAETKWSVFSSGAQPVLNARDAVSQERAGTLQRPPRWFETTAAGAAVRDRETHATIVRGADELVVAEHGRRATFPIRCMLPGEYNRANLAAACAGALALGCDASRVAESVASLALPEGRYERRRIGGLDVIYDAYNASMAGTLATLDAFAREDAQRRIAVLASMAELGDGSAEMHERVGAAAAGAGLSALLVGGRNGSDLERGAIAAGIARERLVRFDGNADAAAWLRNHARAGDLVLLKGSRMYHLEEIVDALERPA